MTAFPSLSSRVRFLDLVAVGKKSQKLSLPEKLQLGSCMREKHNDSRKSYKKNPNRNTNAGDGKTPEKRRSEQQKHSPKATKERRQQGDSRSPSLLRTRAGVRECGCASV